MTAALSFGGSEARRFSAGRLSAELLALLEKTEPEDARLPGPELVLLSAHDTTLFILLNALEVQVTEWPPLTATLAFEVVCARTSLRGGGGAINAVAAVLLQRSSERSYFVNPSSSHLAWTPDDVAHCLEKRNRTQRWAWRIPLPTPQVARGPARPYVRVVYQFDTLLEEPLERFQQRLRDLSADLPPELAVRRERSKNAGSAFSFGA